MRVAPARHHLVRYHDRHAPDVSFCTLKILPVPCLLERDVAQPATYRVVHAWKALPLVERRKPAPFIDMAFRTVLSNLKRVPIRHGD